MHFSWMLMILLSTSIENDTGKSQPEYFWGISVVLAEQYSF